MTTKQHPKHWKFATVHEDKIGDEVRDIPGTGGTYRITKDGIVLSQRHPSLPEGYWIVMKCQKSKNSRPFNRVCIAFDGYPRGRICQVSRLLLEAWVGPAPSEFHVAAHRNGVTDDDRLENLMWALPRDVSHGQICRGTWAHGQSAGRVRFQREQVEAARKIVIDYGVPANLLATALNLNQARVREWLTKTWDTDKWDGLQNPLIE
jgi:hypothetical protein